MTTRTNATRFSEMFAAEHRPFQMALEDLAAMRAIHGFGGAVPGRCHRCRRRDRGDEMCDG